MYSVLPVYVDMPLKVVQEVSEEFIQSCAYNWTTILAQIFLATTPALTMVMPLHPHHFTENRANPPRCDCTRWGGIRDVGGRIGCTGLSASISHTVGYLLLI